MRMRVGGMMILCGLMAVCAAVQVSCNEYTCDNGTATAGNPPGTGNVAQCARCNDGYYLDGITCVGNTYTCTNGDEADPGTPGGVADGGELCASCDGGYHAEGNGCAINEYMCDNGMKMDNGEPGGVHDGQFCASCIDGYHKEGNGCAINEYMCANGMKMDDGEPGGVHNGQFCSSCNATDPPHFLQTDNSCQTIPGSGTTNDPYELNTYEELDTIRNDLDAHYELTADIDAMPSWSAGTAGCIAYNGTNGDSADCTGWVPVGPFIGSLDGRGFAISNLYINRSTGNAGMFSEVGLTTGTNRGIIRALRLSDLSVRSEVAGESGGLVGRVAASGLITECSIAGTIFKAVSVGSIGGLVGENRGTITHSFASGSVTRDGSPQNTGGLVGWNNSGKIISSYATNRVNGDTASAIGGLVGFHNLGSITTSYSNGEVNVGESATFFGGLIGTATSGSTITNSFWNTTTSGQSTSAGGTGLTTAEMQTTSGDDSPEDLGTDDWLFEVDSYPRLCADDDGNVMCEEEPDLIFPEHQHQ